MTAVYAGDVMNAPVISVKAGTTLQEAVKKLAENNIGELPCWKGRAQVNIFNPQVKKDQKHDDGFLLNTRQYYYC